MTEFERNNLEAEIGEMSDASVARFYHSLSVDDARFQVLAAEMDRRKSSDLTPV